MKRLKSREEGAEEGQERQGKEQEAEQVAQEGFEMDVGDREISGECSRIVFFAIDPTTHV